MGGFPHDVIVGPFGEYAYVSVLGLPGENDYVVQFRTDSFMETGRAAVGKDPHLSLTRRNNNDLYVPSQGGNAVYILNRFSMEEQKVLDIPGAHGAGMTTKGKFFYTTNLPGGGTDGLFTIDTKTNTIVGEAVDTPYPVPHNVAINLFSDMLFLTHSGGTADKVTFYHISSNDPVPVYAGEVTVGLNPFGLSFVP
jgi:DNA-binding beta-propeller fold protein YncE